MQNSEDMKLLYQYLVKYFQDQKGYTLDKSKDMARKLIKEKSNNLWDEGGLAWWLGGTSLEFFCLYFLSNIYCAEGCADIAPVHRLMWQQLTNIILHKSHEKQVYILPRGTGKSSFISMPAAIWSSLYKYKRYTVIASAIGDTAETFIRNIKLALDGNEKVERAFGKIYDPKNFINNSEKVEFANRTMIQSISASSTLRGKSYGNLRIELLLLDDYQKDDEITTNEQRERKWKRFSDDVNYAMQKDNATYIACGTVQHKECFYSRLQKSATWKCLKEKGVLIDDVDELFDTGLWLQFKEILFNKTDENGLDNAKEIYFQNKEQMQFPLLWQSYWDCLDMALKYHENPYSFKQEVQGSLDNIGEKRFKTIITEKPEMLESHNFIKTMLCIDPAGTRNKNKSRSDYYAFVVGSIADNNIKYVRRGSLRKFEFEDYLNYTIELLKQYEDIVFIYVEKNTYSGADVIRLKEIIAKDEILRHRDLTWINEQQTSNKDDKINTIVGDVNMGRIIFNEEDTEAIDQLKEFAGCNYSLHDDFPDIVSEFAIRIDKIEDVQPIKFFDRSLLF